MAKIKLSQGGFTVIPEGDYIFKVGKVEYKEKFGKMTVTLLTKDGQTVTQNYGFIGKNGEVVEGAVNAFSYFAKTALNNFTVDEIDDQDIVGCYIGATVVHELVESRDNPDKMLTFINLTDYKVASGFEGDAEDETDEDEDIDDLDDLDDLD
jgi:hypothetical protein